MIKARGSVCYAPLLEHDLVGIVGDTIVLQTQRLPLSGWGKTLTNGKCTLPTSTKEKHVGRSEKGRLTLFLPLEIKSTQPQTWQK